MPSPTNWRLIVAGVVSWVIGLRLLGSAAWRSLAPLDREQWLYVALIAALALAAGLQLGIFTGRDEARRDTRRGEGP